MFSLALASAAATPTVAANILPFILSILSIVNGIFVPHGQMPNPWRDFVYWANPVVSWHLIYFLMTDLHINHPNSCFVITLDL